MAVLKLGEIGPNAFPCQKVFVNASLDEDPLFDTENIMVLVWQSLAREMKVRAGPVR
jgi:hypothetical protein